VTLKLEAGKYYVNGYGCKEGPARAFSHKLYCFALGGILYTNSGQHQARRTTLRDLVSEWVEPKVEPDVSPFGKLTPEEQGALMVAFRNGETIEYYSLGLMVWHSTPWNGWNDVDYYRIKPKTKMQAEYWVVFRDNGEPLFVDTDNGASIVKGYYKVHHPAVEIKE